MRKEIPITNYFPLKLKHARELAGVSLKEVELLTSITSEELSVYETEKPITPIDIFLVGFLLDFYKIRAKENNIKNYYFSLTSDILYPHPKGLAYQEAMVAHPNFKGIPYYRNHLNNIGWVATAKSKKGEERLAFWSKKMKEFGIKANDINDAGIRQKVALLNHPTKVHVCLFTGNSLYIDYRYPAPGRIDIVNAKYNETFKYYDLDIIELAKVLFKIDNCKLFIDIFNLVGEFNSFDNLRDKIQNDLINAEKRGYVSPGAMSNSPDRLDGYHSYNSDVRELIDTGREKGNLKRYTQDRRVYENWADGDWKQADRLYAEFQKNGVSPDHIGPISLGFCHRPKFQPMTSSDNSSKGNRMTLSDLNILLIDEKNGECVISWHSRPIWDRLKVKVKTDIDARKLSSFMRENLHHILIVFSDIYKNGHKSFLEQFLNPQYSYFDYDFEGFDPKTGSYTKVNQWKLHGKNQQNNAERYHRIAFEELNEYINIDNRNSKIWNNSNVDKEISTLLFFLSEGKKDEAKDKLNEIFELLAKSAEEKW